jgi:hypothetical protein
MTSADVQEQDFMIVVLHPSPRRAAKGALQATLQAQRTHEVSRVQGKALPYRTDPDSNVSFLGVCNRRFAMRCTSHLAEGHI